MPIKVAFLFLSSLLAFHSYGQLKPLPSPPKEWTEDDEAREQKNLECLHRNTFTSEQRTAFYPFNKAQKVMLISYDFKLKPRPGYIGNQTPINKGKIDLSQIDEQLVLAKPQIDSLTAILYNIGYSGQVHTITESLCFNPRNALAFMDSKDKVFAYIEICFECARMERSSPKVMLGEPCTQKYDLLKAYFISLGIEVGTLKMKSSLHDE